MLLGLAGAAAGYVLYVRSKGADVRGSSTQEFVPTETAPPPPPPAPPNKQLTTIEWPNFGYDAQRLHFLASTIAPPFQQKWLFRAHSLVEFPPAIGYGTLYFANNTGTMFAVHAGSGKVAWHFVSGRCVAASPALDHGVAYEAFLNKPPCNSSSSNIDGELIAFDAKTGKIRWRQTIGPSETSPLVANGLVYVGDWRGNVYAFDARTGKQRWSFATGGKVKGGVAVDGRRLYVGSYDGHVYALNALTGKELWRASSQARLGSSGTFYSTPAVAYGRVYIGSTDGKVYSFGAHTGDLRWSHSTGGYVYGSPAVWKLRVLVGSYSGRFYAFDAATGDVRWQFQANGPISGSATVLGHVVYFSTLKERTYALDARTGKLIWSFPDGKYSPVVSDGLRVFLVGYARIYAMVPK
ncbi:MAG TPA: PQQ-binding-like beta-propeller repeat protein [Gaiellaceae bacterium]|nr:PQQ-binding-like beta-propeller repeat protein [Gaiellaceae bacterium]